MFIKNKQTQQNQPDAPQNPHYEMVQIIMLYSWIKTSACTDVLVLVQWMNRREKCYFEMSFFVFVFVFANLSIENIF